MVQVVTPPDLTTMLNAIVENDPNRLLHILTTTKPVDAKGRYLHWHDLRFQTPPIDLTPQEWWLGSTHNRRAISQELPIKAVDGKPFWYCNIDTIQQNVHRIDQNVAGNIGTVDPDTTIETRDRYLVSSLIAEEAITSAMLEGAATTRRVAKELLETERKPRTQSEQMIINNYAAMAAVEQLAKNSTPLILETILDIHRIVTEKSLKDPRDAGRLQEPNETRVMVVDDANRVVHKPPDAEQLPDRMQQLCAFANGEGTNGFVHPVVRATLLHFWLGYDHPFVDGNGRTARALFYWSMLRSGYWLARYFSISTILRKAPAQYLRSYLQSETDNNDATYFIVHQLNVIVKAIDSLNDYIVKKSLEVAEVEQAAFEISMLNHRQLTLIKAAYRNPYRIFTIAQHQKWESVTYQTARTDLLELEHLKLLQRRKVGKKFEFRSCSDLPKRLRTLAEAKQL